MILIAFTLLHVLISLIGIGSGFVVLAGMLASRRQDGWINLFMVTTIATRRDWLHFMFPSEKLLPSHIVGAISLAILALGSLALYRFHLAGGWRQTWVITSVTALYFNVFVLVVQLFGKVPMLNALAPTQSEPPFLIAQLAALLAFLTLGTRAATIRFRPGSSLQTA